MKKMDNYIYWDKPKEVVITDFNSSENGITEDDAKSRLIQFGMNSIKSHNNETMLILFFNQFKNPIMLIMLIATIISGLTGDWIDSLIIFIIVFASVLLSFYQEYSASNAIDELKSRLQLTCRVYRNKILKEVPTQYLVPGDVINLSAGSLIPADGLIITCDDFYVNQSILTGESIPVEKKVIVLEELTPLSLRINTVFTGTTVYSGSASILVINTGIQSEFGKIAQQLAKQTPENEFERGIRHFGYLLTEVMLFLTLIVFAINVLLNKPAIDSLLFSVALAVGITPQLLPAIINITLSKGAKTMAKEGVIVRHLTAIENFGSMDVLCTDKTGTLTEGIVKLNQVYDALGNVSDDVFRLSYLNSKLQIGLNNSLDQAIIDYKEIDVSKVHKQDEIPYDFKRKRLSIIIYENDHYTMITKGAFEQIVRVCKFVQINSIVETLDNVRLVEIQSKYEEWSNQGYRVLGVACKPVDKHSQYLTDEESNMIFMGFLLFYDPPKEDVINTLVELNKLGVQLRMITGDNRFVAFHTANMVGLKVNKQLTGSDLMNLDDKELHHIIDDVTLFSEVDPSQKERIIIALKKLNHVVGYMGDGINDAPALHVSDVSISVNSAVDVAKDAADFVLLEKDLSVLKRGIELGRISFSNTLKYIYITTSANFGNMFSMAGASLFMPFLPLLPKQILLINFITDFPALTLSNDSVDIELVNKPRRWDIKVIRNFMFTFGFISSIFDYLTFFVLLFLFQVNEIVFQSSWFVLSILTELIVLILMRTQKAFFKSKPAPLLLFSSIGVACFTLIIPYLPLHQFLSIIPVPIHILFTLMLITLLYIVTTEITKFIFYKKMRS